MKGIDFSYWRPPSAQWVKDQSFAFVCRYLSYDPRKTITKDEFDGYQAAGVAVVLVWENGAKDMLFTGTARQYASDAKVQADAIGAWPCVIYVAADWDTTPSDQLSVNASLDVWSGVIGLGRVGIYGGYYTVMRAMQQGHAAYGWQTYAWSGGQWFNGAQLRQIPGGNAGYDLDEAMTADFGQIGGNDMTGQEHDWLASVVTSLGLGTTDATKWPNYPAELASIKARLDAIQAKTGTIPPGTTFSATTK